MGSRVARTPKAPVKRRAAAVAVVALGLMLFTPVAHADEVEIGPLCGTSVTVSFSTNPPDVYWTVTPPSTSQCPKWN